MPNNVYFISYLTRVDEHKQTKLIIACFHWVSLTEDPITYKHEHKCRKCVCVCVCMRSKLLGQPVTAQYA